jgi:geranylgeranyl diphosphate synthase, type II
LPPSIKHKPEWTDEEVRMDIKRYLQEKKEVVDSALERYFPYLPAPERESNGPSSLHNAIRHSLFAGGKRIRPILSMAAFEAMGGTGNGILPFACALEMIHTYSLMHDDLPAIDNDDYRRGKPTCHKVYGEAIGILAGDALLTEAFRLMAGCHPRGRPSTDQGVVLDLIREVAQAAGILGMVGGQVVDVESEGKEVDLSTLAYIHTHKTGAMISVSIRVGARLGGAKDEALFALTRYGERIGHAFQIADDILNVEGDADVLGKKTGSDSLKKKATYPSLLGLEESKRRAKEMVALALDGLGPFGREVDPLREIARFIVARKY